MGVVHIRSTQSGQYLAMDTNGLLYGSVSASIHSSLLQSTALMGLCLGFWQLHLALFWGA